jgi:glutamate carboxypeptidase
VNDEDATELPALLARLAARAASILQLTERLVRINSHTHNVVGVDTAGRELAKALPLGTLSLSQLKGDRLGTHLCFETKAAASEPCLLLIGHHDTVFPPGTFDGFRQDGQRAYGPGVLDMKGGLSLVATVLSVLDGAGLLAALPIRFISVSDEEIGSPTSRGWLEQLALGAEAALVFEAGRAGDKLITARRGVGSSLCSAHGKAAHAGNALAEGHNAVWALARFIDKAQRLNGSIAGASLNVGLAAGGTARNTVPDRAQCELDLRFSDPEGEHALSAALLRAAEEAAREVPGTRLELTTSTSRKPWARTDAAAALCARYAKCQEESGLLGGEADTIGGSSDANTVGAIGVPTIDGLGPRGSGFHTKDEQIEIASLARKAEALLRFIVRWREQRGGLATAAIANS